MNAPYYANTNPENPTSRTATEIRKAEYQFWERLHPDPDDDIETISQSLSDLTGARQSRIRNIIFAFERLKELPRLRARQEQHFHLDLDRLITIDQTLAKLGAIDAEKKFTIDDALTNYLTPNPSQSKAALAPQSPPKAARAHCAPRSLYCRAGSAPQASL